MCHTIRNNDKVEYPKVNSRTLVGTKRFYITTDGLLSPPYLADAGNYKLSNCPLGYRFTTETPVTEQKLILSISGYEVQRLITAGIHISPYSKDSIGEVSDYVINLLVCFYPSNVVFFDGYDVSVTHAYIPKPSELIVCSDDIKDNAIKSWTLLHQVLNTEGIENVGSSNR